MNLGLVIPTGRRSWWNGSKSLVHKDSVRCEEPVGCPNNVRDQNTENRLLILLGSVLEVLIVCSVSFYLSEISDFFLFSMQPILFGTIDLRMLFKL